MNQFQVTVTPSTEGLGQSLGISEERADTISSKLARITAKAIEEKKDVSSVLEEASELVENANELSFISFAIGAYFESQRNPIHSLLSFLSSK